MEQGRMRKFCVHILELKNKKAFCLSYLRLCLRNLVLVWSGKTKKKNENNSLVTSVINYSRLPKFIERGIYSLFFHYHTDKCYHYVWVKNDSLKTNKNSLSCPNIIRVSQTWCPVKVFGCESTLNTRVCWNTAGGKENKRCWLHVLVPCFPLDQESASYGPCAKSGPLLGFCR